MGTCLENSSEKIFLNDVNRMLKELNQNLPCSDEENEVYLSMLSEYGIRRNLFCVSYVGHRRTPGLERICLQL